MNPDHEEIFKKHEIETVTKFSIEYDNFDNLIREHLPVLTLNSDRYIDFESIAEFGWNNYSNYDAEVTPKDLKDSTYINYDKPDIVKGCISLNFHSVLCFLIEHEILPYGTYEVRVSW